MSRRHAAEKRDIIPDPKFGNIVVSKFMNAIMYDGKKSVAEGIVYGALEMIEGKTKQNPLNVFQQALDNVMPRSRCAHVALAAPHTRCRSKCARRAVRRLASAGLSRRHANATNVR